MGDENRRTLTLKKICKSYRSDVSALSLLSTLVGMEGYVCTLKYGVGEMSQP